MLQKGECNLLDVKYTFPLLLQFSGVLLGVLLFIYRTSGLQKKVAWSSSKTLLLFHIAIYSTLLTLIMLLCLHAIPHLCAPVWVCLLLTLLQWLVNGVSLYHSILPRNDQGVYLQIICSVAEVVFLLHIATRIVLETEVVMWWYWTVLLGGAIWCFLCNIGFVAILYGGLRGGGKKEFGTYELLSEVHGEQDSMLGNSRITEQYVALSVFFFWFSEVLDIGNSNTLTIESLPPLPLSMRAMTTRDELQQLASRSLKESRIFPSCFFYPFRCWLGKTPPNEKIQYSADSLPPLSVTVPLFKCLLAMHKSIIVTQGMLKCVSLCLLFSGPLLLGQMVRLIEEESDHKNVMQGIFLTIVMGGTYLLSAVINVQYNIRGNILQIKLKNALSLSVFSRIVDLQLFDIYSKSITEAQASNLLQVDADRVSSIVNSFHDLWSLPVQIFISFLLLYLQVREAFVAGVIIIIVMIPVNNYVAKKIGVATKHLMKEKDTRVKFIAECFRGIKHLKSSGWEGPVISKSMGQRGEEMKHLARRKYLDAICVFLWATMPLLVPFATFFTTVFIIKERLSVSQVFTTIALLNMLIFPMNSFPWIVNGFMEAVVSFRRISLILIHFKRPNESLGNAFFNRPAAERGWNLLCILFRDYVITACADASCCVVLGGRGFCEEYDPRDKKEHRFFSFATNSSRLYSVIDDIFDDSTINPALEEAMSHEQSQLQYSDGLIHAEDLFGSWNALNDDALPLRSLDESNTLTDSSFSIGPITLSDTGNAQVIVVGGTVGSGKSTLLYSLLQECFVSATVLTTLEGKSIVSNSSSVDMPPFLLGSTSFCPQKPALHTGSVRSNIIFESAFDSIRYQRIVKGCCLDEDFDCNNEGSGQLISDEQDVGQGGCRLSGGQRLRVGIARALYARTNIVLLDDPLSALDVVTAQRVMNFLHQESIEENRIIVLATNDLYLACHCKKSCKDSAFIPVSILFLSHDSGTISRGTYDELYECSHEFADVVDSENKERRHDLGYDDSTAKSKDCSADDKVDANALRSFDDNKNNNDVEFDSSDDASLENIERGHIRSSVFHCYLHAMGFGVAVAIVVSTLCMQATANGMAVWLAYWADHDEDLSDADFLLVSCIFVGCNVLFALLRSVLFAYGGLRAAENLYRRLTASTLHTYLHFFETQTLGRLLNRFGKDTNVIDDDLPFMLNIVLAQIFTIAGALVVIVYSSQLVIVVLCGVAYGYYCLQQYYRRSSRDLRRLEATYVSPVGTILLDCFSNAPVIRAQRLQSTFDAKFSKALDMAQRVSLSTSIASQWLALRLQLLGLTVVVSIAILAVINAAYGVVPISGSRLGLSLTYAFSLVGYLNGLVDSVSRSEQEMISVERVSEYLDLPNEYDDDHSQELESFWPKNGSIVVNNLYFSYELEQQKYDTVVGKRSNISEEIAGAKITYALSDVSFTLKSGSHTVVIGRTGSGKSSLLRALLNLGTPFRGSISIGGLPLREIPKKVLRSKIGVICQEPFIFTGTIREIIDIHGVFEDEEVFNVLQNCGILETFRQSTSEGGWFDPSDLRIEVLDTVLDVSVLSQGQSQLLCVARILLCKPPFVLLDEASSSLDAQSEASLFRILKTHLPSETTLVAVNHRPERTAIMELCPQVLEFEQGKVQRFVAS